MNFQIMANHINDNDATVPSAINDPNYVYDRQHLVTDRVNPDMIMVQNQDNTSVETPEFTTITMLLIGWVPSI